MSRRQVIAWLVNTTEEPTGAGWRVPWLEAIWRDLKFSVRSLRRSMTFTVAVIFTLALCIWANTSILSVLYGLVLKPMPLPDAGQVVDVYNMRTKEGQMHQNLGVGQYLDYREHADLFSGFALWRGWMFNIGEEGGMMRYVGMQVTHEYLTSVLGLQPLKGRFFNAEDDVPGQDKVAVLTQSYWENNFHADPDIVGQEIRLSGEPHTIIGVIPRKFEKLSTAPVLLKPFIWRPEQAQPNWRLAQMGNITARIKPGVAHGAALAQLQTLEQQYLETVADPGLQDYIKRGGQRMGLEQLREQQVKPIRSGLLMLQGGALFVLVLGCVNVASLLLARSNTRQAELAVRQALGASRGVLARQLLTEAALLAVMGGALGTALAGLSLRMINAYAGAAIYGLPPVRLDGALLGLTLLISLGVALMIGLLPVLRMWQTGNLQNTIQTGNRGASRGGGVRALSGILVVAQVAFAFVLLCGAGLLIRSFTKVMAIDPGFDASKIIHIRAAYDSSYTDMAMLQGLQDRILEKMREIPGVDSVAYSDRLPGFAADKLATLPLRGMAPGQDSTYPTAAVYRVSPEYFQTMGIRLLAGRNFTADDYRPGARLVFIVDRKFAELHFPGQSAVGQQFAFGPPDQKPEMAPEIVGVAEVAKVNGLEANNAPYVYLALDTSKGGLSVELRTTRSFADMMPLIRSQLRSVDPALPIYQEKTMQKQLDDAAANRRGVMWLLGAFAGIALLLSAVGIYGMLAYDVTQRTKEIGIRGAIGSTRGQIVTLILRQGMMKAALGMGIGLVVALYLSRYLESLLYEVKPRDPLIFAGVALVLLLVGLMASWLPARRAAKVDPMTALRCE
ncbi:MAG: ABC transporter permease [Cephaloticoccus sp.]|nr:ABC transporter permease [Cephaloticoccus sp.]